MSTQFPVDVGLHVNDFPFTSGGAVYALDLTTSDASITLPTGAFVVYLTGSGLAAFAFGATAAFPSSGGSAAGAFVCPGGGVAGITVDSDGEVLHGIMSSGTATAYITRVTR